MHQTGLNSVTTQRIEFCTVTVPLHSHTRVFMGFINISPLSAVTHQNETTCTFIRASGRAPRVCASVPHGA